MFVGENLTNIRLLHHLTRNELAQKLSLTEQAIWQYENNYISPSLKSINNMRLLFNVQPKFFYMNHPLTNEMDDRYINYRSEERKSRQKIRAETVHLEYLNTITKFFSSYITYPENRIKDIRQYAIKMKNKQSDSKELIEHLALYAREQLGVSPEKNDDLLFALEKNGAFIYEKYLGKTIDAYSTWSHRDMPYIVLGNVKKSAVRRNFDLAHELGHLLLHYKIDITDLETKEYKAIEQEANLFAANFLLPKEPFLKDLATIKNKISNPDAYIDLKKKWNVSFAAMAHRAFSLKVMTYQQYRYFNASLNRKKYKVVEPLDNDIVIMRPGKIRQSFQVLFEKGIVTVDEILDFTKFELPLLSRLVNIEESFFTKYIATNKAKVYDFVIEGNNK